MGVRRRGRATAALVSLGSLGSLVLLSACGPGSAVGESVDSRTVRLECGDGEVQSAQVALEEGAGLPDPVAAVGDAQDTGWLPAGEVSLDDGNRGVVVADGVVVAELAVEEVGGGWAVTSVDTCLA